MNQIAGSSQFVVDGDEGKETISVGWLTTVHNNNGNGKNGTGRNDFLFVFFMHFMVAIAA